MLEGGDDMLCYETVFDLRNASLRYVALRNILLRSAMLRNGL